MLKYLFFVTTLITGVTGFSIAQVLPDPEETKLPGDNFSLEGTLTLFKTSTNPEEFEKLLNKEENHVHNLDLDEDGETDYIQVVNLRENDAHVFILRVPISESENQDIATIHLEKSGKEEAIIQIVGNEKIFGEEIILEPSEEDYKPEVMQKGPREMSGYKDFVVVNVWGLPCVRFVFMPGYMPWVSPWRYRHYPVWWKPWKPLAWKAWKLWRIHHHKPGIRMVHTHRLTYTRGIYKPVRMNSVTVTKRYKRAHTNYKVSRSKTKITGQKGTTATKKTTSVKGKNGRTKAQRKSVKTSRKGG